MYPGWVLLGDSPYAEPSEFSHEIINNARAQAYAAQAGLCWLHDCLDCESAALVIPGGPLYVSPKDDPAPWYDEANPDTWGFLGLIGLEATGAEDSTRHATVTEALVGGGVIGPSYFSSRTIVVRALAIAVDECALQAGLEWFMFVCDRTQDPCRGDNFNFFDCCPCMCVDDEPGGPCWATTYRELRRGPICTRPEGTPAHLTATLSVVTTPDPGPLPGMFTIVARVLGPSADGGPIAAQFVSGDTTQQAWEWGRLPNTALTPGGMYLQWYDGAQYGILEMSATADVDTYQYVGMTVNRDDGGTGKSTVTSWFSVDGLNWTQGESRAGIDPMIDPQDVTGVVSIGGRAAGDLVFQGDVAEVVLTDGIGPDTGEVMWAFAASEYPFPPTGGVAPTTWADPRGRQWTVADPAALVPLGEGQAGAWWPDTYEQLRTGPPMPDPDWCDWVDIYLELKNGLASWSCCTEQCVVPYFRQFKNARIVEGPIVLRHPKMNSSGCLMEVQFTIVAGDPQQYGLPTRVASGFAETADASFAVPVDARGRWTQRATPTLRIETNGAAAGPTTVALWRDGEMVTSFLVDSIPAGSRLRVEPGRVVSLDGVVNHALVSEWEGPRLDQIDISKGDYTVTVNQEPGNEVRLFVDIITTPAGLR